MATKRLPMRQIREILRLKHDQQLSHRAIASACRVGLGTVADYLGRAKQAGLEWPLPEDLDEAALEARLFPRAGPGSRERVAPDVEGIHQELKRVGVTLHLLWEEYREANPKGYAYSQFCEIYRRWAQKLKPSMRQVYSSGGGRDQIKLRNQMKRLFGCTVSMIYADEHGEQFVFSLIAERGEFWWNERKPDQSSLWDSKIYLGEAFFNEIIRYTVPRQLPLRQRRGSGPRQQPAVLSELDGEQQRGGEPRHGYQRRRARVSRTRLLGRRAESVCPPDSSLPDSVDLYLREPALTANPVFPVQDTPNRKASEHRMFVAGAEEPEYRSYRAMWAPQSRR